MKKAILITLVVLIAIILIASFSIRRYLQSKQGAAQVAQRLESFVGAKVQVGQADIGLNSTSLHDLEFGQDSKSQDKVEPWLKVKSLAADLSLWDLVRGNAEPKQVKLKGARLVLHFDAEGNLVTQLPFLNGTGSAVSDPLVLPEVLLEESEVVLRKAEQADLLVSNVNARITNEAGKSVLTGSAENAELGKLSLLGSVENALANVQLKTERMSRLSQEFLDRIPWVPTVTWKEIRVDSAEMSADLSLRLDLKTNKLEHRLALHAQNAKVFVTVVELPAQNASFDVLVEGARVQVLNVKTDAFGGQLRGEADFDFRSPTYKFMFKINEVEGLDIAQLPDDWSIPNIVRKSIAQGKLHGSASIIVTTKPRPLAPAQLSALQAITGSVAGFHPASVLVAWPSADVRIRSQGKGQVRDPHGKMESIDFDWQMKPRRRITPFNTDNFAPTIHEVELVNLRTSLIELMLIGLHPGKEQSKYLDLNLGLKNVDLGALVKNLNLKLPIGLAGKLTFNVKASIPTDQPDELRAYKVEGNATVKDLVIGDARIDEIDAVFVYSDGILTLKSLQGKLAKAKSDNAIDGGTFKGSGAIEVVPQGELRADLIVDRIPLEQLVPVGAETLTGAFSGKLHLNVLVQMLTTLNAVKAEGAISSERLKVYGLNMEKIFTSIKLRDGVLKLPDLQLQLEGSPLGASAEVGLTGAYDFQAKLNLREWNLASLQKLTNVEKHALPTLAGTISTTANMNGQLSPLKFSATGSTSVQNLRLNAFDAEASKLTWETDGKLLRINDIEVGLYDGQASGSATWPFDPAATGELDLSVKAVNVKKLVKDLKMPFSMEGNVSGKLKGTFPPIEKGKERTASLNLDLSAPKLRVQNIPAEKLTGTVIYQKGDIDYKLQGSTLGGTFDVNGQIPSNAKPVDEKKKQESKKGRLQIADVKISRLFQSLGAPYADSVRGRLSIEFQFTHDPGDPYPEGRGVMRITNLRWKDTLLSQNLQGDIIITDQQIRVRNLTASIAEGTFALQAAYFLRQPERSWGNVRFNRVDAAYLLGPWIGDQVEGPINAHIRGTLGAEWRGTANLELERGKAFGFPLSQWRIPINWSYVPVQHRGKIEVLESAAQLARGRALGKVNLSWGDVVRVEGQIKIANAELKDMLAQLIGPNEWGSGRTTARFDFAGENVRTVNDINGNLTASFQQAQALQVPVLKQVAPLIGIGRSTTFQKGELRARLNKGVFRIQQLALEGNNVQMHVDGSATLEGRLNLDIVARTNTLGLPTDRLRLLGLRIPSGGPVPITVIQETSNLLSNRVIYLQVTGTAQSPTIRVQPLRQLSEEALRYFCALPAYRVSTVSRSR